MAIKRLDHISVVVEDLPAAIEFFTGRVANRPVHGGFDAVASARGHFCGQKPITP
jgi:hypothetical protein